VEQVHLLANYAKEFSHKCLKIAELTDMVNTGKIQLEFTVDIFKALLLDATAFRALLEKRYTKFRRQNELNTGPHA